MSGHPSFQPSVRAFGPADPSGYRLDESSSWIFCSGLAYLLWYAALRKKDSSTVGMYLYLEPLVTLMGASVLLGEEIRVITLVGGSMTLLGSATGRLKEAEAERWKRFNDSPGLNRSTRNVL
jgi:drug/metabolite transporter (DMT)-like permease